MFKRNLKLALRKISRKREFTVINTFGLLVGISTTLFIFLWVQDELSYDRFHKNLDTVHAVWWSGTYPNGFVGTGNYQTASLKAALEDDFPAIEKVSRVNFNPENQLTVGEQTFKAKGLYADEEFLQLFDFPIINGQLEENSLETGSDIILTAGMAEKLFGRTDVTGELIKLDNRSDLTVRAVVTDPGKNTRFRFEYILSMEDWTTRNEWTKGWGNGAVEVYAQLRPDADAASVSDNIRGVVQKNREGAIRELFLKPFGEMYLYGNYENGQPTGGRIEYVRLFSLIAFFIIIIACINFINLSIADSFKRAKEVGVRKVVGASKWVLMRQFLVESGLLVIFAFVLSLILVEVLLPEFNGLTGKQVELNLTDPSILAVFGSLVIITILVSGLYPAFVLSGFKTIQALKGKLDRKGATGPGVFIRKGLVIFQFVVAGFLIFATAIISQQIDFIFNSEKNLDKQDVIVMNNDYSLVEERYEEYRDLLLKDPSIAGVTAIGEIPINVSSTTGDPDWDGKDPERDANSFRLMFTEQDFIPTMNLELALGRNFSRELKSDSASVILNEAAIKGMNMEDPIGKRFSMWGIDAKIIGVVKDFYLNSVYNEIEPLVLLNWVENTSYVTVRTMPGQTERALKVMEDSYAQLMPGYVFDYSFLQDSHERMYQNELMVKDLARIFGLIAVFISCLGLFGLTSINAERNVKEIGIRKVLGASVGHILVQFSRKSLVLPTIAALLMTPLAWYFMKGWLADFKYHIDIKAWMLGAVVVLSLFIALATVSLIALRAARANPVNSLRSE